MVARETMSPAEALPTVSANTVPARSVLPLAWSKVVLIA
jgi:hypothetical protein